MKTKRVMGSLLGLALGDAFGAPYEGGLLERAIWAVIGNRNGKRRWTDDTQMSIDVAESLVKRRGVDPDDLARRFARSYRWSRGYGPGAATVLKRIRRGRPWQSAVRSVFPNGSFGNGGAMRAAPIGAYFSGRTDRIIAEARASAAVTHAHEEGQAGAAAVALAADWAFRHQGQKDADGRELLEYVAEH